MTRGGLLQIIRVRDEETTVLKEVAFPLAFDKRLPIRARVRGTLISAIVDGVAISADDSDAQALKDGGIGLLISEGAMSTDAVSVSEVTAAAYG